jgi:hypothetical protein
VTRFCPSNPRPGEGKLNRNTPEIQETGNSRNRSVKKLRREKGVPTEGYGGLPGLVVEASSSEAFPFLNTTSGSVSGVARGNCGCDRVCLPLKATIKTAGSLQWSRHNGVARCTVAILKALISDAPSESEAQCRSIPGKIFNFVPGNGARNVSVGSHSWIACRSRARHPSV